MRFEVQATQSAAKALNRLPKEVRKRILDALVELERQPRPPGVKKLVNRPAWRIRIGDYRVLYEIKEDRLIILVVEIGHRREIYRD